MGSGKTLGEGVHWTKVMPGLRAGRASWPPPKPLKDTPLCVQMLGEDSELVQELASRGLIETHGLASGATREELVKRLIVALSGDHLGRCPWHSLVG